VTHDFNVPRSPGWPTWFSKMRRRENIGILGDLQTDTMLSSKRRGFCWRRSLLAVVFRWLCLTPPALEAPVCHWETRCVSRPRPRNASPSPVLWCWRRLAEFAKIPAIVWARHNTPRTVVDCWRVLPHLQTANGVRYISLGTGGTAAFGSKEVKAVSSEPSDINFCDAEALSRAHRDHPTQRDSKLDAARSRRRNYPIRDEPGTAAVCSEFGLRHEPQVAGASSARPC